MDNRDFWPYMRVAKLPEFDPSFISLSQSRSQSQSRLSSLFTWLFKQYRSFYRYCYVHLHDLILSSLFGYLTLNEKLYVAIHENDLYKARKLLSHGASPSFLPADYKSIFTHLIKNNNEIQNYYIETSLFSSILANDSMLYMAVSNDNFNLVKELIHYHNYGQIGQHTEVVSLCLAVKRGYSTIVEYLIDYGHINPNDRVQLGCKHCKSDTDDMQRYQFPLYHACRENHLKLVKYLIKSKHCDINQLTTSCETCLHGAILGATENCFDTSFNNQERYFIVQYLLTRPDCNPNLGLNPLCISLAYDNIYDYTSLLLQHYCDVNRLGWNRYETTKTSHKTNSYLLYSLDHPLNICLRRLCQTNKNVTTSDHSRHKQYALKLINKNSNIYAMYDYGSTYPFLLAVQTGDKTIVEAIVKKATLQIKLDIVEPLIYACTKSFYDIVQILVNFGFNPNTIMINRDYTTFNNLDLNKTNSSDFLRNLDRYCTFSSQSTITTIGPLVFPIPNNCSCSYMNSEQQITPLLALSHISTWLFHPDQYDSTIKTIENLFSHISIDFSILPNRLAFHYALLNEHIPIIYYCLENLCPINFLHDTIELTHSPLKNHFSYTLFHVISVCCRLASNNQIKRALFNSYTKAILRINTYDRPSSMTSVLAYMQLWFHDQDFVYDPILFEHLMSLPYVDDIIRLHDKQQLRSLFGTHYYHIIERKSRSRLMYTLKHICRLKIRHHSQLYCERQQTNMLKIIPQLNYLPKILQAYLFYTRTKSNSLIDHLLNNKSWNNIQWM
ncbi:unnamed protein product [Rotaria sordida]|uniref:SOCS box domain-containing protein n=1 Tax=Rotaria sordida TaxID=392033 RepID=A0A818ZRX0_9BILA|nr:unnamed protein product [Rotaria sordida]CAF3772911.1 unnamed protein product [Rotaria sordida]